MNSYSIKKYSNTAIQQPGIFGFEEYSLDFCSFYQWETILTFMVPTYKHFLFEADLLIKFS